MKKTFRRLAGALKKQNKHLICVIITVAFTLIAAFVFSQSYERIGQAFYDVYTSFKNAIDGSGATVNEIPKTNLIDLGILPEKSELFFTKIKLYGKMLITGTSFRYYGIYLSKILEVIFYVLIIGAPVVLALIFIIYLLLKIKNNKYDRDSVPLKVVKTVSKFTYEPTKHYIKSFISFLGVKKFYWIIWVVIWALNFSCLTIVLEFFAYYVYVASTFDFSTIYIQFYKLLLDLSVVIKFIPVWVWCLIALIVFDIWRRRHAFKKLDAAEDADEAITEELPIASLICAPMGGKKTTFMTDICLTANKMFRAKAYELILEQDMKFPHFPWILLENSIRYGIEKGNIFNLAGCKRFIKILRKGYEDKSGKNQLRKRLLKCVYGYESEGYMFGYDAEKYGFTYYDNLVPQTVFDVLETYAQLYFIYAITCSLLVTNYAIRVDDMYNDVGNFPIWTTEFFRRKAEDTQDNTRYSHIIDFDALRLGKKVLSNNKFRSSLDFGIIAITEVGKERGNQITLRGKNVTAETANQTNDLFNIDVKMCRHRATVANFPFVLFIFDEQRAASLGADSRELCDILYIMKSSEFKFVTPLFAFDELIYIITTSLFTKFYLLDRHNKGSNTLIRAIIKGLYGLIYRHYTKLFNLFAVSDVTFTVQDGRMEDKGSKRKYRLSKKKIHAYRFATDAMSAFYYEKTKRSRYGIVNMPEYSGKIATFSELNAQHSYFVDDITRAFFEEDSEQ